MARAAVAVLNQRGLEGNGWVSAWKTACWARLCDAAKAMANFNFYIHNYCFNNLFAICAGALQIDGLVGISVAVAEMLCQSHKQEIHLLPVLADFWKDGFVWGLRARGGFEVGLQWEDGRLKSARFISFLGNSCRIRTELPVEVFCEERNG